MLPSLAVAVCMPASSHRMCAEDLKWTPLSLPSSAFSLSPLLFSSAKHGSSREPWPSSGAPWPPRFLAPSPWLSVHTPLLVDAPVTSVFLSRRPRSTNEPLPVAGQAGT